MKKTLILNLVFLLTQLINSQTTYNPIDQNKWVVWGGGYGQNSFNRFPADAQNKIPGDAWTKSVRSSGLHVRFISNGSNRYIVIGETNTNWGADVGISVRDMDVIVGEITTAWNYSVSNVFPTGTIDSIRPVYTENSIHTLTGYGMWQTSQIISLASAGQNVTQNITIAVPAGTFADKPFSVIIQCASSNGVVCSYKYDSSTATSLIVGVLKCDGAIGAGSYRFSIQACL